MIFSNVQNFQNLFRIFSNVQNLFRIFSNFQNLFRIFSNFQNLFRIFSNVQNLFRICSEFSAMFRIFSEFWVIFRIFRHFSEFLAQKLVCSESLDFVVIVFKTMDRQMWIVFADFQFRDWIGLKFYIYSEHSGFIVY